MSGLDDSTAEDVFAAKVRAVGIAIQAGIPVLAEGEPGVAKSSLVEQMLGQLCAEHHVSIASLHEPPEYGGHPCLSGEGESRRVMFVPTEWQQRLARVPENARAGLHLDELNNAPRATRSAALRGILDGTWGELKIERLSTVASINPTHLAERGEPFSAALANRFCHVEWSMPADYWLAAFASDFTLTTNVPRLPQGWDDPEGRTWGEAKRLILHYGVRFREQLQACPKASELQRRAWPSYRTWTMAHRALVACSSVRIGLESLEARTLVGGLVGLAQWQQLVQHQRESEIPDPETLLADPDGYSLDQRGDVAWATLQAVVGAFAAKPSAARYHAAWRVLARARALGHGGVAMGLAKQLGKTGTTLKMERPPSDVWTFVRETFQSVDV